MTRQDLKPYLGQEVGIQCVAEYSGQAPHGPVRCVVDIKVMNVVNHRLQHITDIDHIWVQHPDEVLQSLQVGKTIRAIGRVQEYRKKGGVKDYTIAGLRIVSA